MQDVMYGYGYNCGINSGTWYLGLVATFFADGCKRLCFLQHIKVNITTKKVAEADIRIGKTTTIIICHVDRCWYKRNPSPNMENRITFKLDTSKADSWYDLTG